MLKFLNFDWIKPENKVYFFTAFWSVAAFVVTWLILEIQCLINVQAACLWTTGLSLSGALVGLIFAIPKTLTSDPGLTGLQQGSPKLLQENTNLFQISDWLTKTIVGADWSNLKISRPMS